MECENFFSQTLDVVLSSRESDGTQGGVFHFLRHTRPRMEAEARHKSRLRMLSSTAPIFTDLSSATARALAGYDRAVGRVLRSADSVESMRDSADGGQFTYASRLQVGTKAKAAALQGFQNTLSYVQTQEAGLLHAEKVYQRMSVLSAQALDPLLDDSLRQSLNLEFQSLKEELETMRAQDFQGTYLYDDMAAWTVQFVDFSDGLDESQTPTEVDSDGTKRWISSADVLYSSGKITLDVNSGRAAERYYVKQGNQVIFDSGSWKTEGNAYNYDFDRFVIEFAPGQDTTFEFVPMDTAGSSSSPNSAFDNEPYYLSQLGVGSTAEVLGQTYVHQGNVTTNPAHSESTVISIVVESTTLFQATAKYEQTAPTNYVSVGDHSLDASAYLEPVGFGVLSGVSIDTFADASSAMDSVAEEIEGIGVQMGKLSANLAELRIATERASQHVSAGRRGLARMTEALLAEESTRLTKAKIKMDQRTSLMVQARNLGADLVKKLL